MTLSKLHFITQPTEKYSNAELVEKVCLSGVKLIQLRIKDQSLDSIYEEAKTIKGICNKFKATFILNDHVAIAKELNLDGVHLGKTDLSPIKAREILGGNTIIGGTANDLEDIKSLINAQVDYIGLGPYKYTETKKKLSPILGLDGYLTILKALENNSNVPPIYAIGGITKNDILPLVNLGIYGIALSGLIANAKEIESTVRSINDILNYD